MSGMFEIRKQWQKFKGDYPAWAKDRKQNPNLGKVLDEIDEQETQIIELVKQTGRDQQKGRPAHEGRDDYPECIS
jgi:hypothetical protein